MATIMIGFTGCTSKNNATGTYRTLDWNGKEAFLVLNNDGSCEYPGSEEVNAHWVQENEVVIITLTKDNSTHEADMVDNGIILHQAFLRD